MRSEAAADDARREYVDVWAPSAGHDICAGTTPGSTASHVRRPAALAYHPFAVEQQAVADLRAGAVPG